MNRKIIFAIIFALGLLLTLSLATFVFAQDPTDSQPEGPVGQSDQESSVFGDDSNPESLPEVQIPDRYSPDRIAAPNGVAEAQVYFTPQDENTSTTVLFLYNTSSVTATVGVDTFQLDGTAFLSTAVAVPPASLVRICADSVSTVSGSWQDVVLINFTTFSTYARMTLPAGVKAEGFVVWNNSGTYDPLQVAPTLPLRFSIDPPTVFLPTSHKN